MPSLRNARNEAFAQALADGKTQLEAHALAGFKAHRGNSSSLAKKEIIVERVAEILREKHALHHEATALAAERLSIDREWVLAKLVDNVNRSMQSQAVMTEDGEAIGQYRYDGAVANRALELVGKELGMFIERSKSVVLVKQDGIEMRDEELELIASRGRDGASAEAESALRLDRLRQLN